MINLLPPRQKKIVSQKRTKTLVLILGIVGLSALLSLILILSSIRIYVWGQSEVQKAKAQQAQRRIEQTEIQDFSQKIESANQTFSYLASFYQNQPDLTLILEEFSNTLPPKVYLTKLSLGSLQSKKEESPYLFELSASGFCPDRETLVQFKQNLGAHPRFGEPRFPPSNWIKAQDINFSLTLKVTK